MRWSGIVTMMICALCLAVQANAQAKEQTKQKPAAEKSATGSKVDNKAKSSISAVQGSKMSRPTMNLNQGTVGSYFYPMTPGSFWKMRTVSSMYDLENKLLASDTMISREVVSTNSAVSIQGLPLIKCTSKSFRLGESEAAAKEQEVTYYVDDSLIMAVFNNSVNHNQNVALLTSPLKEGFVWPERFGDTVGTMVVSLHEPVETPAGKFENAVVTSTKLGYGELSKYFVAGNGIVKMVFRGPVGGGKGTLVVTTDLIEVHHETSHMEGSPTPERQDPTMR
jgi:hypothetical protein